MGLRIETNLGALSIVRNLQNIAQKETQAFERLSTGLQINRGSDNPAGLIIFEALRGEMATMTQAMENTQNGANLLQTAEAGLSQIGERLTNVRALAVAAGNPILGPEAQGALQAELDQNIQAIQRISQTTRFVDTNLLNGNLAFNITNASPQLTNIQVYGGIFEGNLPTTINIDVQTAATQAQVQGTIAGVQPTEATFRVAGPIGTQEITVPGGATQSQVEEAINAVRGYTGVYAEGGQIKSEEYGKGAFVQIENVEGELAGVTAGRYAGTDVVAQVEGQQAAGAGNVINVATPQITAQIQVQAGQTGQFQFQIAGGGATFQINTGTTVQDRMTMGIGPTTIYTLGETSGLGSLASTMTGGANSLVANPQNAANIIASAQNELAFERGRIGSVISRMFEPNIGALGAEFENIAASSSYIGEANIAEEAAKQTRNMIMRRSALNLLKQTSMNAGFVLNLLR
jgi:flagellin